MYFCCIGTPSPAALGSRPAQPFHNKVPLRWKTWQKIEWAEHEWGYLSEYLSKLSLFICFKRETKFQGRKSNHIKAEKCVKDLCAFYKMSLALNAPKSIFSGFPFSTQQALLYFGEYDYEVSWENEASKVENAFFRAWPFKGNCKPFISCSKRRERSFRLSCIYSAFYLKNEGQDSLFLSIWAF